VGKEIKLNEDLIFKNSVQYNDNEDYDVKAILPKSDVSLEKKEQADALRDSVFDLLLTRELDKTDLQIIESRNCSPMPSMRETARQLGITEIMVRRKLSHIKALMPKELKEKMKR